MKRIGTGNRELDDILGGGIPENSINIIMGEPGSGKTTLAQEFIFANADNDGRPTLYSTTISEPLDKVIKYLQHFEFYDEAKMGVGVQYETWGTELAADGAQIPKLLRAYLTLGAKICGPPALDREFKTIDFLTLLDLETLHPLARQRFLG